MQNMLKMHHDFRDRRNPGATGFQRTPEQQSSKHVRYGKP